MFEARWEAAVDKTYRLALRKCVEEVADLLSPVDDFSAPGLGEWDLLGLVGHFARAIRTPLSYLEQPEPDSPQAVAAAHYVASYLDRRAADPESMDNSVASRGREELSTITEHPSRLLRAEARRLDDTLLATSPDRLIASPFGPLRLDEYMRTRGLEITVHALDIARALGVDWQPPTELITDAVTLLGEVAALRGTASDLLMVLTGRTPPDPRDVLPVLR